MNIIGVRDLGVQFAEKALLSGVTFGVQRGEILTVLGANGCGKSTLLHALLGMQELKTGEVLLEARRIGDYSPADLARKIAFLPQASTVPNDLTVGEWVACGRYPYQSWWKPQSAYDREVVAHCLEATHLTMFRDRRAVSLSGGERQRVRIAMALAQEPEIIMLDEPTTYLDLCHQLEVMELLRRINGECGTTVIMVLHDVNQAARYSDRLLVLADGGVYRTGSPQEVLTEQLMQDVYQVRATIELRDGDPYCYVSGLTH